MFHPLVIESRGTQPSTFESWGIPPPWLASPEAPLNHQNNTTDINYVAEEKPKVEFKFDPLNYAYVPAKEKMVTIGKVKAKKKGKGKVVDQ